jgi:low affinity Fe/Cu permease
MTLAGIAAQFRAHPIAMTLELGSILVCCLLFAGTFVLLSSGAPTGRGDAWLVLIGVGVAFVLFWTALVPLYERTLD